MSIRREHIYIDFRIEDFVYHTVLLCDGAAPLPIAVSPQRFRMTGTSLWMFFQLLNKLGGFLVCRRLRTLKPQKVFYGFRRIDILYISSPFQEIRLTIHWVASQCLLRDESAPLPRQHARKTLLW